MQSSYECTNYRPRGVDGAMEYKFQLRGKGEELRRSIGLPPIIYEHHRWKHRTELQSHISENIWEELFSQRWAIGKDWKTEYLNSDFYYPAMEIDYFSHTNYCKALREANRLGLANFLHEPNALSEDHLREEIAFLAIVASQTAKDLRGFFYREQVTHERYKTGPVHFYRNVCDRRDFQMSDKPSFHQNGSVRAGQIKFPRQSYHGRGPLMLCGAYNYGRFSEFAFGDSQKLLENPDLLLHDGVLGFLSAIWYWMRGNPSGQTAHSVIYRIQSVPLSGWGFGYAIVATHSAHDDDECAVEQTVVNRNKMVDVKIRFYRMYAKWLKVTIGLHGEQLDIVGLRLRICQSDNMHKIGIWEKR